MIKPSFDLETTRLHRLSNISFLPKKVFRFPAIKKMNVWMLLNLRDMKDMNTLYSLIKKFKNLEKYLLLLVGGTTANFFTSVITKQTLVSMKSTWNCEIAFSWEIKKKIPVCVGKAFLVFREAFGTPARVFDEANDLLQNSRTFLNPSWQCLRGALSGLNVKSWFVQFLPIWIFKYK